MSSRRNLKRLVLAAALLACTAAAVAAGALPPPGPRDRCAVCGMFVLPHPTWVAGLRFPDGRIEYFDGPKDLFRRLASPEGRARPGQAFVTDYYTTEAIPAATAWFVAGSDVLGPMGRELIPFSTEEQARGFARDHRGEAVLSFREVTPAILKTLE